MHSQDSEKRNALEKQHHISTTSALAQVMLVEIDQTGRLISINRRGANILGYESPEQLINKNWFEVCRINREQDVIGQILNTAKENPGKKADAQSTLFDQNGTRKKITWTQIEKIITNQGTYISATGYDVADQQSLLRATLKSLQIYKFALDESSILATTDHLGVITFVNDKFCDISQYPKHELLGKTHKIINSSYHEKSFFKLMWTTIAKGHVWRGDIKNKRKDGTYYWVHTTIIPVYGEDKKKPSEYIAVRNEITARKEAEAALHATINELAEANRKLTQEHDKLLQAEKMASVGILSAGVAHEINNPLSGVMACVKALADGQVKPEKIPQYFETARDGLERIQQTVRGLLDFSRQRPPQHTQLHLRDVIDTCIRLMEALLRKQHIDIVLDEKAQSSTVHADRSQLMQALVNLLLNATYASSPHSKIDISLIRLNDEIGIIVGDYGSGMSDEVIKRACDPFFSTKPEGEGTGLGLAVTLSIAQAHNGRLSFERRTSPQTGTLVTLWLGSQEPVNDSA